MGNRDGKSWFEAVLESELEWFGFRGVQKNTPSNHTNHAVQPRRPTTQSNHAVRK
jgi:hypothetical protein